MAISLASLLIQETKEKIYDAAIGVARAIGLPVSTWQAGDPTRSLYWVEAEMLSTLEELVANFIRSGFLDYATGIWLKILAEQVFGVEVPDASYATTTVRLTNAGGNVYTFDPGDLTFKNSLTGKTYHNVTGGTLPAKVGVVNGTLDVDVEADEAGSASSAGATEINALVTAFPLVTCSNATAAVGTDEQDESVTRSQCRAKLDALSPDGAKDAYSFILKTPKLSLLSYVPRVRAYSDSDVGEVRVFVAGPSGAISAGDRTIAETAVLKYCTPLCITPVVASAAGVTVNVSYELWIYKSCNKTAAEIEEAVEAALEQMFAQRPIGGDVLVSGSPGVLSQSLIEATIKGTFPQIFKVIVSTPAADTSLDEDEVAQLGTVTPNIHVVVDPS